MHQANVFWDRAELSRGIDSKQLVTELHTNGFARDEAVEMLRLVFGVTRGAARLFVASHPVWAAGTAANDWDGLMPVPECYERWALPRRN
jgi:hypothetical protein